MDFTEGGGLIFLLNFATKLHGYLSRCLEIKTTLTSKVQKQLK